MLFNFQTFIQEMRENPEKKEVVEKYEKYSQRNIEGDIIDQIWYKEYTNEFGSVDYTVPDELVRDFDWDLLMKLVACSFSSDGSLNNSDDDKIEFVISVQSEDQLLIKKVNDLWGFQILRLYEIYAEEQMNEQISIWSDEKEKKAIEAQRKSRLQRWEKLLITLGSEQTIQSILKE